MAGPQLRHHAPLVRQPGARSPLVARQLLVDHHESHHVHGLHGEDAEDDDLGGDYGEHHGGDHGAGERCQGMKGRYQHRSNVHVDGAEEPEPVVQRRRVPELEQGHDELAVLVPGLEGVRLEWNIFG